jgi:hypothetical protein
MKGKITRFTTRHVVLAAVLLTAGAFGSVANAQSEYQGKFTLTYEVQWGKAVLHSGTYLVTLPPAGRDQLLVIRNEKSQRFVAFEPISIREDSGSGESALLIGTRGKQRIVYSFRNAELGQMFVYDPALAHPRVADEANKAHAIPVLTAKQ